MKVRFAKLKKHWGNNKEKSTIFENLLFSTCIVGFVILVTIQVVLLIPSTRNIFKLTDNSIGVPLSKDDYLYNQGQITLKMIGTQPDPAVRVLVNGDDIAMFENLTMSISVNDGDVIEIDGSGSVLGHIISVESVSENISSQCSTAVARVESNIQKLVKVQVE